MFFIAGSSHGLHQDRRHASELAAVGLYNAGVLRLLHVWQLSHQRLRVHGDAGTVSRWNRIAIHFTICLVFHDFLCLLSFVFTFFQIMMPSCHSFCFIFGFRFHDSIQIFKGNQQVRPLLWNITPKKPVKTYCNETVITTSIDGKIVDGSAVTYYFQNANWRGSSLSDGNLAGQSDPTARSYVKMKRGRVSDWQNASNVHKTLFFLTSKWKLLKCSLSGSWWSISLR